MEKRVEGDHYIPKLMGSIIGRYYRPGLLLAVVLILLFFHLNPSTEVPQP